MHGGVKTRRPAVHQCINHLGLNEDTATPPDSVSLPLNVPETHTDSAGHLQRRNVSPDQSHIAEKRRLVCRGLPKTCKTFVLPCGEGPACEHSLAFAVFCVLFAKAQSCKAILPIKCRMAWSHSVQSLSFYVIVKCPSTQMDQQMFLMCGKSCMSAAEEDSEGRDREHKSAFAPSKFAETQLFDIWFPAYVRRCNLTSTRTQGNKILLLESESKFHGSSGNPTEA